jgi:hypothetical protein
MAPHRLNSLRSGHTQPASYETRHFRFPFSSPAIIVGALRLRSVYRTGIVPIFGASRGRVFASPNRIPCSSGNAPCQQEQTWVGEVDPTTLKSQRGFYCITAGRLRVIRALTVRLPMGKMGLRLAKPIPWLRTGASLIGCSLNRGQSARSPSNARPY